MAETKKGVLFFLMFMLFLLASCSDASLERQADDRGQEETESVVPEAVVKKVPPEQVAMMPPEMRRIHERGKLVVGMYYQDRYPYFFNDEKGRLVGSDVDMAYDIARQLGVGEVEFDRSARSYGEIVDKVAAGEVDMAVTKLSMTLLRAQRVLFSDPYIKLHQALLMNRVQFARLKVDDAAPLQYIRTHPVKIGVVGKTSYEEFAKEIFPNAEIQKYSGKDPLMQAAVNGEILAAFYDENEIKSFMNRNPDLTIDLQILIMEDREDFLAIAIPPGHDHLQNWVNQYLSYREDFNVDELLKKYDQYYEN